MSLDVLGVRIHAGYLLFDTAQRVAKRLYFYLARFTLYRFSSDGLPDEIPRKASYNDITNLARPPCRCGVHSRVRRLLLVVQPGKPCP